MRATLILLMTLVCFPAMAAVVAKDAWAPPTLSQPNSVAFLTLTSDRDDRLLSAASDCCKAVELHNHEMVNDVMRMRRVKGGIALPKGEAVSLRPGGYHVMLIGLQAEKKDGDSIPVTLTFEHSEPMTLSIPVSRSKLRDQLQHRGH